MTIRDFVNAYKKGTFGVQMITSTEPSMRKTNNPYMGRVRKVAVLTNIAIGYSYETYVNARGERKGIEGEFKAFPLSYGAWEEGYENIILSHKGKEYLRVTMLPNTTAKVTYMVDGRVATEAEVEEIKSFLTAKAPSARQSEYGLTEEQVVVRNYATENILSLTQGVLNYTKGMEIGNVG